MKVLIYKTDDTDEILYRKLMELASEHKGRIEVISSNTTPSLSFPGLTIDCLKRRVYHKGKEVRLTRLEYDVLYLLALHTGRSVTKKLIFDTVWGRESENTGKVVANTVSNLRGKLEEDRQNPAYIHSVFGGYLFCDQSQHT